MPQSLMPHEAEADSFLYRPLAHLINFRFIGSQHRVLYINCVQVSSDSWAAADSAISWENAYCTYDVALLV